MRDLMLIHETTRQEQVTAEQPGICMLALRLPMRLGALLLLEPATQPQAVHNSTILVGDSGTSGSETRGTGEQVPSKHA